METQDFLWIPGWLLMILVLIITYCVYMCKDYGVFRSMGVSGPPPLPVLGNTLPYFKVGIQGAHDAWFKRYGRVYGIFEMNKPNLIIGDPEMLREILVKQFHNFTNRRIPVKQSAPFDKMLAVLKDGHWKHVRSTITPTFSSGKLKKMTGLVNLACDKFVANLTEKAENKEDVEIKEACAAFSVDVIGSAAFGIDIDSQNNPNQPFVVHGKAFFKVRPLVLLILMFCPSLLPLVEKFPSERKSAIKFFENVVKATFDERKADSDKRNDFLQLMIDANKADEEEDKSSESKSENSEESEELHRKGLTFDEILAQSTIFFLGGLETTAGTLALVFYSLALHPDILEKTLEEIDRVLGKTDRITYEQTGELCYLEQVICESQRIYPVVRVDRVCSATTRIKGITIPKDMIVSIPIGTMHHDEKFWPNPEKFDPDRFRADVKGDINPFTFMPFGYGPRNCIAMRLALVEMKMAAARVLRKLRPVKVSRTQEKPVFSKLGFLKINGGAWIGIEKRE